MENYLNITSTSRHLDKRDEHIKFYFWASNNATSLDYIDPNRVGVLFYDQRKKHFGGKGILGGKILLLSSDKIRWHLDEKLGLALEEPDEYTELIGFSVPSEQNVSKANGEPTVTPGFWYIYFHNLTANLLFQNLIQLLLQSLPFQSYSQDHPIGVQQEIHRNPTNSILHGCIRFPVLQV